ncbi:hypothetical protein NDU88_002986 [Pleurodeles waltl]|uniref:Uncharacterized protein n=1 Tax=Pleurodeles waltl TaxID=8319 RepID=A0AAV7UEJ5_PLEWA|nr:hypothetical protein NDU88_002986 [Pleurodeles waltl]
MAVGTGATFSSSGPCLPPNILRATPRAAEWGAGETGVCLGTRCPPGASGLPHRGCESQRVGTRGRPRPHGTPGTPGTEPRDRGPQLQRRRAPKCSIDWSGERERGGADPPPP